MGNILYAQEHLKCPNYDKRQRPSVEERFMEEGQRWEVQPWVNKIVFVLEGKVIYSMGQAEQYPVCKGQLFFLPANNGLLCLATQDARLGVIRLYDHMQFCDCFRMEDLNKIKKDEEDIQNEPFLLETNPIMEKYLEMLTICYRNGLRCRHYNDMKIKELMYILRGFYPKEDLMRFFSPALSSDTRFSQYIMSNYNKYTNLTELAHALNYTVSGFEKKFRKVFGCSPYSWIRKQQALEAYHLIASSEKSFKHIADIFGFNSVAAFNKFIRQHFDITPGQIRRNNNDGGLGQ